MFSEALLHHFQCAGQWADRFSPVHAVRVENPVCGDILELSGQLLDGRLASVGFRVRGCTASIAAGSALATLLDGATWDEAVRVDATAVEAELGGLASTSKHAARLAADGARKLLEHLRAAPST